MDFLKQIDARVPEGLDIHIIMDNYATHKTAVTKNWLARRPHYHVHFTPTSASWINQVERWFADLTRKQIRRGVHTSTSQLEADIRAARKKWRASKGERLRASVPHGHWKTTTFVAGLRLTGLMAPRVLDGPINGLWFQAYVDQVLVPTLSRGDIVIIDNLGSHKGAGVRQAIEASGAKLIYLPPYSPDFNPIEKAFSKLKAPLRKAAERTVDGLWNRIGELLHAFTPSECANFFAAAAYEPL